MKSTTLCLVTEYLRPSSWGSTDIIEYRLYSVRTFWFSTTEELQSKSIICSLLKLMRDARRAKVNTAVHFYSIVRGQIRDCHCVIDLGRSFTYYCAQKNSLSIAHYPPVPLVIVPVLLLTAPFVSDGYIVRQGRSPITLIAGLNESPLILIRLGFRNKRTSYYHVRQKDTS